jgi:hypothetical protein
MQLRLCHLIAVVSTLLFSSEASGDVAISGAASNQSYRNRTLHIISYNSDIKQHNTHQGKAFHNSMKLFSNHDTVIVKVIGKGIPWHPHLFFNK